MSPPIENAIVSTAMHFFYYLDRTSPEWTPL